MYGMERSLPKNQESVKSRVYRQFHDMGIQGFEIEKQPEEEEKKERIDLEKHHDGEK